MIELDGINKQFIVGTQAVTALANINLTVSAGEYISVMGPSGSGKSTLLNVIALLDRPSSGRYRLNGTDVTELADDEIARARRENIGFVFQFFHLIPRLSAAENIELPMILAGRARQIRRQRVSKALADYGLTQRAGHRPDQLSGGQRQRVAIARATIMQPKVILADEPTGNLDRQSGAEIVALLEQLRQTGVTLIVVTHDPALGKRASRQLFLVDGEITRDERKP